MSDAVVDDYLARLEVAASILPGDRRAELVEEISSHIAEARAAGQAPDEASLRGLLDRLGDPDEIVAAAQDAGIDAAAAGATTVSSPTAAVPPASTSSPWGAVEVAAVLVLGLGGFFIPLVSPLVGLFLTWVSPKWTRREKWVVTALVGTLIVPILMRVVLNTFFGEYGLQFNMFGSTFAWAVLYWGGQVVAGIFLAVRLRNRD